MRLSCILHDLFRDTPLALFGSKSAADTEFGVIGHMGIPDKIMQNALQSHWLWVNRTARRPVKSYYQISFGPISPLQLECQTSKWRPQHINGAFFNKVSPLVSSWGRKIWSYLIHSDMKCWTSYTTAIAITTLWLQKWLFAERASALWAAYGHFQSSTSPKNNE